MSAKILEPYLIFNNVAIAGAVSVPSLEVDVSRILYASIVFNMTGDNSGQLRLQVANGLSGWATTTNVVNLTASAGNLLLEIPLCTFQKLRVLCVSSTGTGTVTGTFYGKGW